MARKNDIEMYSTHNEGKSVVDGRFIKTLKNKIYKYTNSISKNVSINKLDDIVNKYNNTYHSTIKIKPVTVNVKSNTYIDSSIKINNEDPKFNICDNVRISKHKNIFAKGCIPNWSVEVFVIKKLKILCRGHVINDINGEEIVEKFYKNKFQKQIKTSLELKK